MFSLVIAREALPAATIDFRYASEKNVAGRRLYPPDSDMLIAEPMIEPLLKVCHALGNRGLQLVLWDAHREPAVQTILRGICGNDQYVLKRSKHVADEAVDVTVAKTDGELLNMGTDFDSFSRRAHRKSLWLTPSQRRNRQLLSKTMTANGFTGWPWEWWHFDYNGSIDD